MPRLTEELQFPIVTQDPDSPYAGVALYCKNGLLYTKSQNGEVKLVGSGTGGSSADLTNYYTITQVDNLLSSKVNSSSLSSYATKTYVDTAIANISKDIITIVSELPETGTKDKLYLVPKTDGTGNDLYSEYVWTGTKWEFINTVTAAINISDYYTKTEVDGLLDDKVDSDDLSSVATSGSYNDLKDKPTIPTDNSQLANGSNFITSAALRDYQTKLTAGEGITISNDGTISATGGGSSGTTVTFRDWGN